MGKLIVTKTGLAIVKAVSETIFTNSQGKELNFLGIKITRTYAVIICMGTNVKEELLDKVLLPFQVSDKMVASFKTGTAVFVNFTEEKKNLQDLDPSILSTSLNAILKQMDNPPVINHFNVNIFQ